MTKFWSCHGETRRSAVQIRTTPPNILNVLVQLENDGRSRYTIRGVEKNLRLMSKFADLTQPEQVKSYLANKQCSTAYKHLICTYYDMYCKYYKIEWKKPRYKQENRAIQCPKTEKIDSDQLCKVRARAYPQTQTQTQTSTHSTNFKTEMRTKKG